MKAWPIRILAALVVATGIAAALASWRHLLWARQDEIYTLFHAASAAMLLVAAVLAIPSGLRLAVVPETWSHYPFLISGRFWRWLLFGWLVVFFVLGFAFPGQDVARYPCRAACLLWFAVLLTPLLTRASGGRESSEYRGTNVPRSPWTEKLAPSHESASGGHQGSDVASGASEGWESASGTRQGSDVASGGRQPSGRITRCFRILDLLVGNLVVLVLTLEAALRILAWSHGSDTLLLNRTTGYRLKPGLYPNGLRANSLGFADTEWTLSPTPDRRRIAALGDSFSVGVAVAYEDNWLTLLERELGVEVCNFGVCGTGPREYRDLLASLVWQYQPNMVLVPVFIGNDITEWIASPQLSKFHPDALYTELLARRLGRLVQELWRQAEATTTDDFRMGVNVGFSQKTYLELTAGRLAVCRAEQTAEDRRRWEMVERYLEDLIQDCRNHGVPVAFVLIPDEFQIHAELRRQAMVVRGWRDEDLDLLLPQRRLTDFLAKRQVPVLDLLPALREAGPEAFIRNDGHFSKSGHRLAAREVSRWLRTELSTGLAAAP